VPPHLWLTHDRYEAEDLVQETVLKASSALQSFQPGTNLKAWLLPIMVNSHIDHCRRARRHPVLYSIGDLTHRQLAQVSAGLTAAGLHSAEERWLNAVPNLEIGAAMRALPPQFREVVYCRDIEGCPIWRSRRCQRSPTAPWCRAYTVAANGYATC
jgi:RNA polymerase sigma-70 factor (ECF subfamily)